MPDLTNQHDPTDSEFEAQHTEMLRTVSTSRIMIPILIGVAVVGFLFWRQFDPEALGRVSWNARSIFWVGMAIVLLVFRHLSYAFRLYTIADGELRYLKCVELIFIWEFSSAVTPTSVGGSAVALFAMAQENLSAARTAAIVIYTVVLDTFFFVLTLPVLFLFFGFGMIQPGAQQLSDLRVWGDYFLITYTVMLVYGSVFYYGLFRDPRRIKQFLMWMTRLPLLRRYAKGAEKTGNEFIEASKEISQQGRSYHLRAIAGTVGAWSCKFMLMGCLVIAFTQVNPLQLSDQLLVYARFEAMFIIVLLAPTPGGAGFAELAFGQFLSDFIPRSVSLIIAVVWRLLAYYSYLLAGAVILPNWIRGVVNRRRITKAAAHTE